MVKIKICGITNEKDAIWASNLGVDYLGFNFYKNSPRKISFSLAKGIISKLPSYVMKVGVFVNEQLKFVERKVKQIGLDLVQLHGEEPFQYCDELMSKGIRVIKAFRIGNNFDINVVSSYNTDFYLLDTYIPNIEGGTGLSFDWEKAVKIKELNKPIFLAGGLNSDNVKEAIEKVKPYGVDVASGIEKTPRRKDYDKMHTFVRNVRNVRDVKK